MAEPDHSDPPVEPPEPPDSVPPVSAEPPPEDPDEPRRYPSTIGGAFYLLVLGVVALDEWRSGVRLMGGAPIFAAAVRLVLRRRDAGMLAVRHKLLDAAILIVLGGSLIFLAGSIPDQPGGF